MTMREIAAEVAIIRRRDAEAYDLALNEGRYEDVYKMDADLVRAVLGAVREPDSSTRHALSVASMRCRGDEKEIWLGGIDAILSEGQ